MRKIYLLTAALMSIGSAISQDLHFSQTSQTPLLINPAATGVFDGWERLTINHRNQWLGSATQFQSTAIAADVNLGKSRMNDRAHLGLGLMFFNDKGGDSDFGNQQGSISLSGILPMGGYGHSISAGLQGAFGQRSANINNVSFMSQWSGSGFDPSLPSGEVNTVNSFSYADASAGFFYMYDGGKNTFARDNEFKLQIGVAAYHINQPKLKYVSGLVGEQLHRKYVAHARVISEIVGSKWSIDASALQFIQGGHYETILGMMIRYRFENRTKLTGLSHDAFLTFGSYFRVKDAIVPSVGIDWRGFQFGVSYDATISYLRKAYTGSLEFSLSYRNLHDSLFKTRKRRF